MRPRSLRRTYPKKFLAAVRVILSSRVIVISVAWIQYFLAEPQVLRERVLGCCR
jgi:hypothetical protein